MMKKQRYISLFCFALFFFLLFCNRIFQQSKKQKALENEKDQIGPLGTFGMS